MNELFVFNNEQFGSVRMIRIDGKPYFSAKDVADALKYVNPRDAVARHCKGVVKHDVLSKGGVQSTMFIPEGDIYRLIIRSKLPEAEKFEKWVFDEVIPSIRKGGFYKTPQTFSEALRLAADLQEEKERLEIANKELEEEKKQNEPKVLFADSVVASEDSILIRELAKLLKQNGYETGEQRLYDQLRKEGYICKYSTEPTQKAMELGLFERTVRTIQRGDLSPKETATTRVTGKGQQYFINRFLRRMEAQNG